MRVRPYGIVSQRWTDLPVRERQRENRLETYCKEKKKSYTR